MRLTASSSLATLIAMTGVSRAEAISTRRIAEFAALASLTRPSSLSVDSLIIDTPERFIFSSDILVARPAFGSEAHAGVDEQLDRLGMPCIALEDRGRQREDKALRVGARVAQRIDDGVQFVAVGQQRLGDLDMQRKPFGCWADLLARGIERAEHQPALECGLRQVGQGGGQALQVDRSSRLRG